MIRFDGELAESRHNLFIFYFIVGLLQKKTGTHEISKKREPLWSHSQKIIPVKTPGLEHLESKELTSEKNSDKLVGFEAIASVKLNNQKALDNVLPVPESMQSLGFT